MFGPLGLPEVLFILLLALLIFGPRRLPEMGRTIGKALGEFRRATTDLKRSINTEIALEEADERPQYPRGPARKTVETAEPVEPSAGGELPRGTLEAAPPTGAEPRLGGGGRAAVGEEGGAVDGAEEASAEGDGGAGSGGAEGGGAEDDGTPSAGAEDDAGGTAAARD